MVTIEDGGFQLWMSPLETPPSVTQLRYKILGFFFFFFFKEENFMFHFSQNFEGCSCVQVQ